VDGDVDGDVGVDVGPLSSLAWQLHPGPIFNLQLHLHLNSNPKLKLKLKPKLELCKRPLMWAWLAGWLAVGLVSTRIRINAIRPIWHFALAPKKAHGELSQTKVTNGDGLLQ